MSFGEPAQKHLKNTAVLFAPDSAAGERSNDRFAHLMSVRSDDYRRPHALGFGTILEGHDEWFVSIQPDCDAVRLPVDRDITFPLVPLKPVRGGDRVALVVADGNLTRRFSLLPKFRDLRMVDFPADAGRRQVIERDGEGGWRFVDARNNRYRWTGQLRESSALRLAKRYADRLFRIGLRVGMA